jgi:hypothetical protein
MAKIRIEIKRLTLVQDTVRGPERTRRLSKDRYEVAGTKDLGDRYDGRILAVIPGRKRNLVHSDVRNRSFERLVPVNICQWARIRAIMLRQTKDDPYSCNGNTYLRVI